jgi:hypothetical protein
MVVMVNCRHDNNNMRFVNPWKYCYIFGNSPLLACDFLKVTRPEIMKLLIRYDSPKNFFNWLKEVLKLSTICTEIIKLLIYCGNVINKQSITWTSGTNIRMSSMHQSNNKEFHDMGLEKYPFWVTALFIYRISSWSGNFIESAQMSSMTSYMSVDCIILYNTARDVGNSNLFKEEEDPIHILYKVLHARLN